MILCIDDYIERMLIENKDSLSKVNKYTSTMGYLNVFLYRSNFHFIVEVKIGRTMQKKVIFFAGDTKRRRKQILSFTEHFISMFRKE